jgi:predicted nucleic acid-binding protein
MARPVIADSSTLIALEQIGQLDLLMQLFSQLLVPPAVAQETARSVTLPAWIAVQTLGQPIGPQILGSSLGPGESEAISLALELGVQWIVLDDLGARRLAARLGLPVIGVVGVLLAAKRRGLVPAVRPHLDALLSFKFRIAPSLYQNALIEAGEDDS